MTLHFIISSKHCGKKFSYNDNKHNLHSFGISELPAFCERIVRKTHNIIYAC